MKYSFWSRLTLIYTWQRIRHSGLKYGIVEMYSDFKDRDTLYDHQLKKGDFNGRY